MLQTPAGGAQRRTNLIVIHCSATPSGKHLRVGTPGAAGYQGPAHIINAWHAKRGFARRPADVRAFNAGMPAIGYHYVIDLNGAVHSGRALHEAGAHAQGFNANSVGICLVGGAEPKGAQYTAAQWRSLREFVSMLTAQFNISPAVSRHGVLTSDSPVQVVASGVCGHRDLSPDTNGNGVAEPQEWLKTCPGFDVAAWLKNGMQPTANQIVQEPV